MNNIILKNENYPLTQLPDGETSIVIPDITVKDLIPRTFAVSTIGDIFRIVESENSKIHQISKNTVNELVEFGFEDDEICELFVTVHEALVERGKYFEHEKIEEIIKEISEKEPSAISMLRKVKQLDTTEIVSIFMAEKPYIKYHNITAMYDTDEYGDGNHE